jgi:aspartyl-tRNA(Asn)/glutamyl-tRNA(Gln) amidotransferase subunit A
VPQRIDTPSAPADPRTSAADLPHAIDAAGKALRSGELSVEELTAAYLRRIERLQPTINAFITVTAEQALDSARRLDAELRTGNDRGPLHGIPVIYKDSIDTRGVRSTAGAAIFRDRVPERDAAMVRRLDHAGMVTLGKANMSELGSGSAGVNAFYGNVHNPRDLERAPGGSSSGTGAALAAGMTHTGIGTDAGGSIRQPASRCGVFGLRPTFGRVSLAGVWPRTRTLGVAGPMTLCARDAGLMLNALAGFDADYPGSLDAPVEDFTAQIGAGVRGLRLGVIEDYTFTDIDPEVEHALRSAVDVLASLGASIETVRIPELTGALEYSTLFANVLLYEFNQIMRSRYDAADRSLFGPAIHADLARGAQVTRETYERILRERPRQSAAVKQVFGKVDALLAPVLPNVTPLQTAGPEVWALGRRFNLPFSFVGAPSASVPCGLAGGMPVGLQVVANDRQEALLLRIADAFEQATDYHRRRSPLFI